MALEVKVDGNPAQGFKAYLVRTTTEILAESTWLNNRKAAQKWGTRAYQDQVKLDALKEANNGDKD